MSADRLGWEMNECGVSMKNFTLLGIPSCSPLQVLVHTHPPHPNLTREREQARAKDRKAQKGVQHAKQQMTIRLLRCCHTALFWGAREKEREVERERALNAAHSPSSSLHPPAVWFSLPVKNSISSSAAAVVVGAPVASFLSEDAQQHHWLRGGGWGCQQPGWVTGLQDFTEQLTGDDEEVSFCLYHWIREEVRTGLCKCICLVCVCVCFDCPYVYTCAMCSPVPVLYHCMYIEAAERVQWQELCQGLVLYACREENINAFWGSTGTES